MGSKGGVTVSVMTVSGGQKRDSTISISDQLSIPSISIGSDLKPDFKIEQQSPSDYTASSSVSSLDAGFYESSEIRPPAPTYVIDTAHAV